MTKQIYEDFGSWVRIAADSRYASWIPLAQRRAKLD